MSQTRKLKISLKKRKKKVQIAADSDDDSDNMPDEKKQQLIDAIRNLLDNANMRELTINVIRKALKKQFGKIYVRAMKPFIKSFVKKELLKMQAANPAAENNQEPEPAYTDNYPEENATHENDFPDNYGGYSNEEPPINKPVKKPKAKKPKKKKKSI